MTEGVDIPDVDTVVFSDPRSSFVDIIQAIGRALRIDKQNPEKVANIVIPVFKTLEEEDFDEKYMHIYSILQSLKFTDQELSMDIDFINSSLSQTKSRKMVLRIQKLKFMELRMQILNHLEKIFILILLDLIQLTVSRLKRLVLATKKAMIRSHIILTLVLLGTT